MFAITVALITTAAIGLHFSTTRWLGIAAIAALALTFPKAITAIFLTALVAFVFVRIRKP